MTPMFKLFIVCWVVIVLLGAGIWQWGGAFVFGVVFGAAVTFAFCCMVLGGLHKLMTEARP